MVARRDAAFWSKKLGKTKEQTPLKKGNDMPKITVTGQAQPRNECSIPASQADPMPKMPLAPGSQYVEPAQKTATGTSSVGVNNTAEGRW
jgi:hypothetical protein